MEKRETCIFDIDGVLNYYPDCYVDFVNSVTGEKFNTLDEIKDKLSHNEYKKVKELYRTSGYKEDLAVREGAQELLYKLSILGYYIIILSSRPVDKYNTLIPQTTNWLKKNRLEYDYLTFGENKHLDIIQKFGNVKFVVEDNRYFANNIATHGYTTFLLNNQYNKGETNENVVRINNITEVIKNAKK